MRGDEMSNILIVTRHSGMVDWLSRNGVSGRVVSHASAEDVRGMNVYGNLPMHLAALADSITTVDMDLPAEMRGQDISADQMDSYDARMTTYQVRSVEMNKENKTITEISQLEHLTTYRIIYSKYDTEDNPDLRIAYVDDHGKWWFIYNYDPPAEVTKQGADDLMSAEFILSFPEYYEVVTV